jgi:hypothetical protein
MPRSFVEIALNLQESPVTKKVARAEFNRDEGDKRDRKFLEGTFVIARSIGVHGATWQSRFSQKRCFFTTRSSLTIGMWLTGGTVRSRHWRDSRQAEKGGESLKSG